MKCKECGSSEVEILWDDLLDVDYMHCKKCGYAVIIEPVELKTME